MKFSMEESEDIHPYGAHVYQELSIIEKYRLEHATRPMNVIADLTMVKKNFQHMTEDMGTI